MRPRIMISTNLGSGQDFKSVNALFTIPQPRNLLYIHISHFQLKKKVVDTVYQILNVICGRGS